MKKKFRRSLLKYMVLPIGAIMLVAVYICDVYSPIDENKTFIINRGDSVTGVARRLKNDGMILSDDIFKFAIRINGGRVRHGEYDISPNTGMWRMARMMAHGHIATTNVTIPEGFTIQQVKILLSNNNELTGDVECVTGNMSDVCQIHDGDIFPDTYRVARGTTRLAVLGLAQKKMSDIRARWEQNGRVAPRPLRGWDEIVTLASIVQRETPRATEMPIVASVYINRLRQNMRLQADPTVVYAITGGLGDMGGRALTREHLKTESPYNTYANAGLPPGPIANVGMAALRAVLRPAETNYLFFVADGTGGHHFSRNYDEHRAAHNAWREIKKSRARR
ncbi:MAG: endolytic transglycosylase MltG [Alphaproteobacteria bacterium]|nr:endolytic transglycosylase MltG [Alphaproteobacteria bacterium]